MCKKSILFFGMAIIFFACSKVFPSSPDTTLIGDDGTGEISPYQGEWDFDVLTHLQRYDTLIFGGNTAFFVEGDSLCWQSWLNIDTVGNETFADIRDLESLGLVGDVGELKKGVLTFYDGYIGGYPPNCISTAMSPVINLTELELTPPHELSLKFDLYTDVTVQDSIPLFWQVRWDTTGLSQWSEWLTSPPYDFDEVGAYSVVFSLIDCAPPNTQLLQFTIGTENKKDEATEKKGPVVDNAKVGKKETPTELALKPIPDIDQTPPDTTSPEYRNGICMAAAYANCLWYWGKNGFPSLIPEGANDSTKAAKLKNRLAEEIYKKAGGYNKGVTAYLKKKKTKYHRRKNPKGLKHQGWFDEEATYNVMKANIDSCHDVLLQVVWYDSAGNRVDYLAHWLTLAGATSLQNNKGKIYVSNPWDGYRGEGTQKSDFDEMKIEVDSAGRMTLKNADLVNNVVGSDNAKYCKVSCICKVYPGKPKKDVKGEKKGRQETFEYTIINEDTLAAYNFLLFIPNIPFDSVQSPTGWDWRPLPYYQPGQESDPNWSTGPDSGVYWYTETNPVPPGDSLTGFAFYVDSSYHTPDDALLYIVTTEDGTGTEHGFTFGPTTEHGVYVTAGPNVEGDAGSGVDVSFNIFNLKDSLDFFTATVTDSLDWPLTPQTFTLALQPYADTNVVITVYIPDGAIPGTVDTLMLTAVSGTDPEMYDFDWLTVTVSAPFIRGDVDGSGGLSIGDGLRCFRCQFVPGWQDSCRCDDATDADDNGAISIGDCLRILRKQFVPGWQDSVPPPCCTAPQDCGPDPTLDTIGCEEHPCMGGVTTDPRRMRSVR